MTTEPTAPPPMSARSLITQATGAVSMCWKPPPAGVFDSERASAHVDTMLAELERRGVLPPEGAELVDLHPEYEVTTWAGGAGQYGDSDRMLGAQAVDDPFVHTTVIVDWRDAIKMLLKHRKVVVRVVVSGNRDAYRHVMNPRPLPMLPAGEPMTIGGESSR